jgi:hypothetical protein
LVVAGLLVAGCQRSENENLPTPEKTGNEFMDPPKADYEEGGSMLGELKKSINAINPFSDTEEEKRAAAAANANASLGGGGAGIGVNSYLWRASLDTISFMPLSSADPFGGVIITDWHSPEGVLQERFKMNVFILVRSLRADGVRVSLFRQVRDRGGTWRDAGVPVQTASRIEDAILTRARQLRSESLRR